MRWVIRLGLAAAFAVGLVALIAWLTVRASLPVIDGSMEVAGLDRSASITRDAAGIPTIVAASRLDLAFATGFAHGQDRFFQMDLVRRQAAGELSELIGSATVERDKRLRFHRFRSRAQAVYAGLDDAGRALLERYADGVNTGLESLGARPFEYFLLGSEPAPWRPDDSLLVWYAMFLQLNDERADRDVQRGFAARILPPEVFDWIYPDGTSWDAPVVGEARAAQPIPGPDVYDVREFDSAPEPANERGKKFFAGSNNWVVGGALTENGRALVANDMHLGHAVPNIWYQARLVVEGSEARDLTGVTIPGTPFVVAGSNGNVAWGFTNSYGDWSDAVLLRPGDRPDTYRTPDGDREFEVVAETILVKDAEPVEIEFRETIWGPVRDDIDYPDGDIAVAWLAHHVEAVNLRNVDLETAGSAEAALDIAATVGMPPQNFVVGDANGNIGWTIVGQIPLKTGFDPWVPADWSETEGWQGWIPHSDYPRITNPAEHRIWTANSRVVDGEALAIVGDGGYDLGARTQQIRDALFAREQFSAADMLAIQYDDRAVLLSDWHALLTALLERNPDAEFDEYRALVGNWIPRAVPESVGYRLVRAFRLEVQARVFHGLMGPVRTAYDDDVELRLSNQFEGPLMTLLTEQPEHLLPAGYESWDGLMLDAIRQNVDYFTTEFEGPLEARTWGERNTARIRHPLSQVLPFLSSYLDMPAEPLNGDVDVPKAQGPSFGASERFAVAPGDEANGIMHMPTGQSGHPLSAFYRAGHDDWVHGRPSPFLPGEAVHTLVLVPVAP